VKRLLLPLVVGLLVTTGVARGNGSTFSALAGASALPSASVPNGSDLSLAPAWTERPVQPVQLSYDQMLQLWQNAGQSYGIPWNVLAAINKIESNFGRNMGPSSAGAIGWMQFMPSTWERWGTDADASGFADPWNPVDAIYSAARYLAASGGATDIRRAVFSYNHADWYVNQVLQLAQLYGGSDSAPADAYANAPAVQGSGTVVGPDPFQAQLDAAQAAVSDADAAYQAALDKVQALAARGSELTDRADGTRLLSNRLEAQMRAVQFGADVVGAARAEADRLKQKLEEAQAALTELQNKSQDAASGVAGAPAGVTGNWVFPVGGGPAAVTVSHYHHDYPAADIAAPEGSPLFALSDGTVLHAWSWDERCGTGFTMQTADGQTWTYCHMSYLEPSVTDGAQLAAGDQVGLVGQTGHATGPHLHLQLQPAATYPQDQDWFRSFAGTAFSWSDPGPAQSGADKPLVFHILRTLD
jgi:murein DD-endopeptidase MepM/ murein hydrolase activator NlpD